MCMDLCDAYDIYDVDTNTCDAGCDALCDVSIGYMYMSMMPNMWMMQVCWQL